MTKLIFGFVSQDRYQRLPFLIAFAQRILKFAMFQRSSIDIAVRK